MKPTDSKFLKIKYSVQLRKERVEGSENDRLYLGLEHIESNAGKLINTDWDAGDLPMEMVAMGESLCNLFEPFDVLFGKLRPYLAKTWVATFSGRCTTEIIVLIPKKIDPYFLKYHFLSQNLLDDIAGASYGSKMPRVDWDFIGNQKIFFPKIDQQRHIATYLDRETAHIDALIATKERQLSLLAQKRQVLIAKAVTHGFETATKMKNSGIDWLGMVPEGWEVKRLRYVCKFNPTKTEIKEVDTNTEVSFLPMEAIGDDGTLNLETAKLIDDVSNGYTYFREGDVTIAKITPCFENGKGAIMRGLKNGIGFGTTELIVVRPVDTSVTGDYLYLIFSSHPFRLLGESFMYGAGGQKRVPDNFVRDFKIAIPPLKDQNAIVNRVKVETSKIDALRVATERSVELLKERRAALISAAVTGQIEIPNKK